ncbi:MAG: outer membrane protein assembly factor BamC [Janthinobacterium lividum]
MKRIDCRLPLIAAVAALGVLGGCTWINDTFSSDRINYRDASSAPTLAVPPDLTAAKADTHYLPPPNTQGLGGNPTALRIGQSGGTTMGVPTPVDPFGMHVEADGKERWLVVDGRTPQQLWPQIHAFWEENGFVVAQDSPTAGVMETDWAENRAKIPQDWFRKMLGHFVDPLYSSGTRDKFTTRVERGSDGSTSIYIRQQGMEEVLIGREQVTSRWEERPRDPTLEAAVMARLMQKLGLTEDQSEQALKDARPVNTQVALEQSAGAPVLVLGEAPDRAWLRVGMALDRTHFSVDNRDRNAGIYTVRAVDPSSETNGDGIVSKLFGGKRDPSAAPTYRVAVKPAQNGGTQVSAIDASGNVDDSSVAQRLMSELRSQLN